MQQQPQPPLHPLQRLTRPSALHAADRCAVAHTKATLGGSPLVLSEGNQFCRQAAQRVLAVVAVGAGLLATCPAAAATGDWSDFILNVARYAAWPADPTRKNLTICYAHGGSAPSSALVPDASAAVKGVPVVWRAITNFSQVSGCNVLWLNADVRPAPRDWLVATRDFPILTISNYADFTADGGIVGAYKVGHDWRFELNLEALQRSRINIAAAALRLSQKPKPAPASGGEAR